MLVEATDKRVDVAAEVAPWWLSTVDLHRIAERVDIPVPDWAVASSPEEAAAAAVKLGFPVAVKADAGKLLHKSDVGGVHLGLTTADEVARAVAEVHAIPGMAGVDVMVQRMSAPGVELIVSQWEDDVFGSVLMVGTGGRLVELLKDVQVWLGPLTPEQGVGIVRRLAVFPLLTGYRGGRAADIQRLGHVLSRISESVGAPVGDGALQQLEINPLIVAGSDISAVDIRGTAVPCRPRPLHARAVPDLTQLFRPRTLAVVGASRRTTLASQVIKHTLAFGYDGELFPVNAAAAAGGAAIHGLPAVGSIEDLPPSIDYGIVAVPAGDIPATLAALGRRAAFVQVLTSGFGEAGQEGEALEAELKEVLATVPARMLGPNCLGLHSTSGGVTFVEGMVARPGAVSVISQSGGLAADILRQGQARGIAFDKVVTIGNALDLTAEDLLESFIDDAQCSVIGLYLEGTRDGQRLHRLLAEAHHRRKSVVLLHGGRSTAGARAVASHTGALTGADTLWQAMADQTRTSYVQDLDEFLLALAGRSMLRPATHGRVLLVGPSGGMSVLATDLTEQLGLELAALGPAAQARLDALDVPPGTSLRNPVDTPAGALAVEGGALVPRIVRAALGPTGDEIDHVVVHLNPQNALSYTDAGEAILRNVAAAVAELHRELARDRSAAQVVLVLRPNGEPDIQRLCGDVLTPLWDEGVPAFLGLEQALRAIKHSLVPTHPEPRTVASNDHGGTL